MRNWFKRIKEEVKIYIHHYQAIAWVDYIINANKKPAMAGFL